MKEILNCSVHPQFEEWQPPTGAAPLMNMMRGIIAGDFEKVEKAIQVPKNPVFNGFKILSEWG